MYPKGVGMINLLAGQLHTTNQPLLLAYADRRFFFGLCFDLSA